MKENENINWEPSHIKEGRFGEWLREIKDWAISRERYWGTPLPAWQCDSCDEYEIVGSIDDIKNRGLKSGNKYFVMRHGEAENNVSGIVSCGDLNLHHITEKGRGEVLASSESLKEKGIDLIFVSPLLRTRETAALAGQALGLENEKIIIDERLHEINCGVFDGKPIDEYNNYFNAIDDRFIRAPENGENYSDIKKRVGDFIYDIDEKYSGKNILIVTHDSPAWMLFAAAKGLTRNEVKNIHESGIYFFNNAEVRELPFDKIPHNAEYELDLHRPFIDEILFECKCGGKMTRVKEVMDVWFDSGAMPFAQDHYPFSGKKLLYPADFISEAIDQTRGWFYTLHAVGLIMGLGRAYKNVICLGHLLDANGKKMSKSIGNVVDPWEAMDRYGADVLRFWMYSINQPGESKNFDEKTVVEVKRKVFDLLENVLSFYELYRDQNLEEGLYDGKPNNILDKWILSKLNLLIKLITENLDSYKLIEPTRAIKDFIGDLSTWYLRRSRDRIKDGDVEAKRTLYFVLKNLAKLIAPFAPFTAEHVWLKLRVKENKESIHLTNWPSLGDIDADLITSMEMVRNIVTLGLEARQKAGIKVRQPLAKITISDDFEFSNEYLELIKDELNVKEVIADDNIQERVELDLNITEDLRLEGQYRELLRAIQDLRKTEGLMPSDPISLEIETSDAGKSLIQKFETDLKKAVLAQKIEFNSNDGFEIKVDDLEFKIKIQK